MWHLVGAEQVDLWRFWLALALLLLMLALPVLLVRRSRSWARFAEQFTKRRSFVRASTSWAKPSDLRGLRVSACPTGRFILGRHKGALFCTEDETSVLVIGPTRSGKTSALVVPNLFNWCGPAIVTSTKSELVDITAAHRQSMGPVYVYDPTAELSARYRTVTWSPLAGCDSLDHAWRVAAWLCAALNQGSNRGDNDWAHWMESGKLLVAPVLFAAAMTGRSIVDVSTWIHAFDLVTPLAILEECFAESSPYAEDACRAMSMLTSVDQRPEKERGTVFSTVTRIFSVLNESAVASSAAWNRFNAKEFLERSGTLYLCTPRQSPERVAALFVGLLMTAVTSAYEIADASASGVLQPPLGLFLDEVANIIPVEDLPSLASQGAGRGILLMSILQDLSQLRARYGVDRACSVVNNHTCKVVLPGITDPETVELISKLAGQRHVIDLQVTHGSDSRTTRSYSSKLQPVAAPDAVRQLREGSAMVLYRGRPPAMIRLASWYRDSKLRERSSRHFLRNADHVTRAA